MFPARKMIVPGTSRHRTPGAPLAEKLGPRIGQIEEKAKHRGQLKRVVTFDCDRVEGRDLHQATRLFVLHRFVYLHGRGRPNRIFFWWRLSTGLLLFSLGVAACPWSGVWSWWVGGSVVVGAGPVFAGSCSIVREHVVPGLVLLPLTRKFSNAPRGIHFC